MMSLAAAADVVVVQEAHCCRQYPRWLNRQLAASHEVRWFPIADSPVGGLGFVVSKAMLANFTSLHFESLLDGRIAIMILSGPAGDMAIYNVHMDHESHELREKQLHQIAEHQTRHATSHIVMAGDWNFAMAAGDRISPTSGNEQAHPDREAALWDNLFPNFTELFQPEPTRRGRAGGQWARLDCIYSNMHSSELMSRRVGANILSFPMPSLPLSDHAPVFGSILHGPPSIPGARFPHRIPDWVFRDTKWAELVAAKSAESRLLDLQDCWVGLAMLKDIFHRAAEEIIASQNLQGQESTQLKLNKTMGALKAIRIGDAESFRRCAESYPHILDYVAFTTNQEPVAWPPPVSQVQGLRRHAAKLSEHDLKEHIEHEVRAGDTDTTGQTKVSRINMLVRIYKSWKSRRTVSSIGAVTLPDGSITADPALVAKELSRHWQSTFSKAPSNPNGIDNFVQEFMPVFPKIEWDLSESEFTKVLEGSGNSAPGPDGIPYGCWRAAPDWAKALLFTCCSSWLHGAALPADFNWAYLALLPKVERKHIAAGETRPLSLGNTDAKLFASALQSRFAQGMDDFISEEQAGFMPGRSIVGSVATAEAAMIKASLTQHRGLPFSLISRQLFRR